MASIAVVAAAFSHVVAGGSVPGWFGFFVPWLLSVVVSTLLAGRRLALWRLAGCVVVSQFFYHLLFALGDPIAPGLGSMAGAGSSGHVHRSPLPLQTGMTEEAALGGLDDPMMVVMHAIAALVTIVMLRRGEQALGRVREAAVRMATCVWRAVTVVTSPVPVPCLALSAVVWRWSPPRRLDPYRAALSRRGPPALLTV